MLRYVKSTTDHGLFYIKDTTTYLAGYNDADWARNYDDRKSTSEGSFYIENELGS